jgi:hypothetical protein
MEAAHVAGRDGAEAGIGNRVREERLLNLESEMNFFFKNTTFIFSQLKKINLKYNLL